MTKKPWFFKKKKDLCRLDPWPCRSQSCANQECIAYWERRNKAIAAHPSSSGLRH